MTTARQIQNIALTGFMGSGKSSVGRLVADQLRFDFLDTDDLIEARAHKTITRIFDEEGEPAFRKWEQDVIAELAARTGVVFSTGGGVGANEAHVASLKHHALVVCLWASPEKIWERVRNHTHRPLLQGADPQGRIRELLAARAPFYKLADVLLNTDLRSLKETAAMVVYHFQTAQSQRP
jgi:shikimate kinase